MGEASGVGAGSPAAEAWAVYGAAVGRTHGLIDPAPDLTGDLAAIHGRARAKQARARRLLALMGDPHRSAPVVHVGGTSGKGSTAAAIASALTYAPSRTLLHTSPYLQVATEKLTVDGELISAWDFAAGIEAVLAAAEGLGEGPVSYAELWMGLVGWAMREFAVDVAVVEVGAGGRLDVTNVVEPAVSVITSVGMDHTETLGPTIGDIAWHKAGIIKPGVPVVTGVADEEALAVIRAKAEAVGSPLTVVPAPELANGWVPDDERWPAWLRRRGWLEAGTGVSNVAAVPGDIQALNGAMALATIRALQGQGWQLDEAGVGTGLAMGRLPGRMEAIPTDEGPTVVLDGAHNPQKAEALAHDLARPAGVAGAGERVVAVVGVLAAKQAAEVLAALAPGLRAVVATQPTVLGKRALPAGELAAIAREVGVPVAGVEPDPGAALDAALRLAGDGEAVLVTGSLYLVGELRARWYPDAAVVAERTSWPGGGKG